MFTLLKGLTIKFRASQPTAARIKVKCEGSNVYSAVLFVSVKYFSTQTLSIVQSVCRNYLLFCYDSVSDINCSDRKEIVAKNK